MQCEICEKLIAEGKRVRIEGSIVTTCNDCARFGEVVGLTSYQKQNSLPPKVEAKKDVDFVVDADDELIEDYAEVIREKRMRRGLKQEELAKLINEPASLIHRIEVGRLEPSPEVARKLQHVLRIKLFKRPQPESLLPQTSSSRGEVTLGDMVVVKKKVKKKDA